jgi:hypothetical protein
MKKDDKTSPFLLGLVTSLVEERVRSDQCSEEEFLAISDDQRVEQIFVPFYRVDLVDIESAPFLSRQ